MGAMKREWERTAEDRAQSSENEVDYLEYVVESLRAENERLNGLLREVRFHCTYDLDPGQLHAKIWPSVVAFDNPEVRADTPFISRDPAPSPAEVAAYKHDAPF